MNLLRVLAALLRERSTVRAGERLRLSQPATSAALGRLRKALKDELFVRQGQTMQPTDYALRLETPLNRILDELKALLTENGAFDPSSAQVSFRIAGSDFFAEMLMPALAERLTVSAPAIRLQLVDLVPANYLSTLLDTETDLALMPRRSLPEWADHAHGFRSEFVMIARCGNRRMAEAAISPGGKVPVDLFCALDHVLCSPEGKFAALTDRALARIGRERRAVMTLPVFSGVVRAVAESDLVAMVPHQFAEAMMQRHDLLCYTPPVQVPPVTIDMVWHKRSSNNPAHRWLRTQIAQLLADLDRAPTIARRQ